MQKSSSIEENNVRLFVCLFDRTTHFFITRGLSILRWRGERGVGNEKEKQVVDTDQGLGGCWLGRLRMFLEYSLKLMPVEFESV